MCSVHHIQMVNIGSPYNYIQSDILWFQYNYLLIYYLLLIFSPFVDDLSQETQEWDNQSYQPEPEGKTDMFKSQGFGFISSLYFFERNFHGYQPSLECMKCILQK